MNSAQLILESVRVQFGNNCIFKNVSLNLGGGKIAVIVGESGVGKSTLLRSIVGLAPFSGTITLSQDSASESFAKPRVVLVPQQPFLWDHLTAIENVALVRRITLRNSRQQAYSAGMKLLSELDVNEVAERYPFRLSGGEQQRVSIARALAADASVYLLDEITAHLDPRRREKIALLIRHLATAGKTFVVATHDRDFAFRLNDHPLRLTTEGLQPLDKNDIS